MRGSYASDDQKDRRNIGMGDFINGICRIYAYIIQMYIFMNSFLIYKNAQIVGVYSVNRPIRCVHFLLLALRKVLLSDFCSLLPLSFLLLLVTDRRTLFFPSTYTTLMVLFENRQIAVTVKRERERERPRGNKLCVLSTGEV